MKPPFEHIGGGWIPDMEMRFGKWKGYELEEIPDGYILWLCENVKLREPLLSGIAEEIRERGLTLGHQPAPVGGVDLGSVKAIYRRLSAEMHPDAGGHHWAQVALNRFFEEIQKIQK
jgi:uncharacterized protein (DUF3820 family)